MNRKVIKFIGLNIDVITKEQSLSIVKDFVKSDQYHYQISVNVAKLVYAQKDKHLLTAINSADIINADGMPIYLATKLISRNRTTRMGGWDYIDGLAAKYPMFKYYFLGAEQEVVDKVIETLRKKYNLKIAGYRNGYFSRSELPDIIENINNSGAEILFIALGTPTKEYHLYEFKDQLTVKFAVGVGGAFDIIAGKTKRAPELIQKISCEWLYRLFLQPRRMFKRYAVTNSIFIILIFKEILYSLLSLFNYDSKTRF